MELAIGYVVAYAIAGLLYTVFTVGAMIVLYYFRDNPMVKIRNLLLVEIQLFFSALTLASTTFTNFPLSINCSVYVIMFVATLASLSALIVRCILLTLAFNVSVDSVELVFSSKRTFAVKSRSGSGLKGLSSSGGESPRDQSKTSKDSKDSMVSSERSDDSSMQHQERIRRLKRNRFLFKRSSIICIWFSITLLSSFAFLANYFASDNIRSHLGSSVDAERCGIDTIALAPLVVASLIMLIGIGWLIAGFQKIQENFRLKEELYRLAVTMILTIVLLGISQALNAVLSINHPVSNILRLLWYVVDGYQTYTILSPIIPDIRKKSQRSQKRRASAATSVVSTPQAETMTNRLSSFKYVMSRPDSRTNFIKFLVKEFSSENIFFYEAVVEYRASCDTKSPEVLKKEALKIIETYCLDNSPLCVNLSGVCRQRIFAKSKVLDDKDLSSLFTESLQEILDLMLKDSFPRFVRAHPMEIRNSSVPDMSGREDEEKEAAGLYSMHDLELVQAVSKSSA